MPRHTVDWIVAQALTRNPLAREIDTCSEDPGIVSLRRLDTKIRTLAGLTANDLQALNVVRDFFNRPGNLRFRHISRPEVAMGLMARILDPSLVNQQAFGMCGPAAVAISAVTSRKLDYVRFVTSLAERGEGSLGNFIRPVAAVLEYDASGQMPPADWIPLASLRNDPACLQAGFNTATYGGSSGDEVFQWLRQSGYSKVLMYSVNPWDRKTLCFPPRLVPTETVPDADELITLASGLSARGWNLFMMAYMNVSRAIEQIASAAPFQGMGDGSAYRRMVTQAEEGLTGEAPGRMGMVRDLVMGGGQERHWTFVESLTKLPNGNVRITVCNHGRRDSNVEISAARMGRWLLGFAACTDVAA